MPVRAQFEPGQIEAADLLARGLEPHYQRTLIRLLAAHALAERLTAFGYQRVLPTLARPELRTLASRNLAEEAHHAELVYELLAELGVDQRAAERTLLGWRTAPSFAAARYFAESAEGELGLLMGNLCLDMTGLIMIGVNYRESSYAPLARVAELIIDQEAAHDESGAELLGQASQALGTEAVERAVAQWLPMAADFFGPPGSGFTFDCLSYGLKRQDNQELAGLYLALLERRLQQHGLRMPVLNEGYPHRLTS